MRVLIAVDSFKGSISSPDVAIAIAAGWQSIRPADVIDVLPLADGGEGTAEVIAAAVPGSRERHIPCVTGPDGRPVPSRWFALPGGVAVMDLAEMSGIPLMQELDPLGATTRGLGETVQAAVEAGAGSVWIGLGGSASTDGGLGALRALGLRAYGTNGAEIAEGGGGLTDLTAIDRTALLDIPGGVTLLTDVTSPLFGAAGAAEVFGPQKGATPEQVRALDRGLEVLSTVLGSDPAVPGSGAAGGTGYGFAAVYSAALVSGADHIAALTRLDQRIADADLVVTGEGAFDHQSRQGKLVGNVLARAEAAGTASAVIAGVIRDDPGVPRISLVELAGDTESAIQSPAHWAVQAGARLAERMTGGDTQLRIVPVPD